MGYQVFLTLTLLGCMMSLESARGKRGGGVAIPAAEPRAAVVEEATTRHMEAELNGTEKRQNGTEKRQNDLEVLEAGLTAVTEGLKEQAAEIHKLKEENEEMRVRLNTTEDEIEKLIQRVGCDKVFSAGPRIAFSASLVTSGELYRGPQADRTLVFRRVFSNVGNAYDQSTGIFAAPVKGLYYFTFSTFGYSTTHLTGAILMKNGVRQVSTYDDPSADTTDSGSNGVALPLDVADRVSVELWDGSQVFDNLNGHTTFSGFLLFPVV